MRSLTMPTLLCFSLLVSATSSRAQNNQPFPMVTAGQSIQAALDAQPGRMLFLPAGDYEISEKLVIRSDGSGLFGPGRIIQTNPAAPFIEVEHRKGVQFRDLVLTRPEDKQTTAIEAINLRDCQDLVLDNITVLNHRTRSGVFYLLNCRNATIRNCTITNYMRIAVNASTCTLIQGNRITETKLLPTPEVQQQHHLGEFIKKNETKGTLTSQETWERESVKNWHQGSAIIVTSPTASDRTQILGNTIENGAQGIDLHSDHVIVAQNIVSNCFVGMKAMHGSRNVVIIGNQFIKNDLWSIGLMPGAASHAARKESPSESARVDNGDGGSIIANNIISQFGFGNAHWIWGSQGNPILLNEGQKPDNPPLADVVIQGNIVQDSGRFHSDQTEQGPRYVYAIRIARKVTGIHHSNNIFDPGREGISNVELKP